MRYLDPTLDVVFKRLVMREPALLIDMLEAILGRKIHSLEILETERPGAHVDDKRIVVDIRVRLDDGTNVVVEMQRRARSNLRARLGYYVARNHSDQLRPGEDYDQLAPTVVIIWLLDPILDTDRLHSIFELRERHDHTVLDDRISIHVLQLTGTLLPNPTSQVTRIQRWARFFRARTELDFHQLASEDPIMATAVQTLAALSQDPETRRLACWRAIDTWFDDWADRLDREKAHDEGYDEGIDVGLEQGLEKGRAELLLELLRTRFGSLPEDVESLVRASSTERLSAWAKRVLTVATLEDVLAG